MGYIAVRHADTLHEMYSMSLNGVVDRILRKDGEQGGPRFHSQRENFVKIERLSDPDHWVATAKDGTKYRFGYLAGEGEYAMGDAGNTGSRQDGCYFWQDGNPRIFKHRWFLDRIEDTSGNVVTIRYRGTRVAAVGSSYTRYYDRSVYPEEIVWNDRGGQPRGKVQFNRTEGVRQDPVGSGINEYETAVLNNVAMYVNTSDPYSDSSWSLVRRYVFSTSWVTYTGDTRPDKGYTRTHLMLNWVQEKGSDDSTVLPKWTFTYQSRWLRYFVDGQRWNLHQMPYLSQVTNGQGGKVVFGYEDNEGLLPNYGQGVPEDDKVLWHVVKTRQVYDGRKYPNGTDRYQQDDYTGSGWRYSNYENTQRPDFRGYNIVTVQDGLNTLYEHKHMFFQGDDKVGNVTRQRANGTTVLDSEGLVGLEYVVQWLDNTSEIKRVWTDYHQYTWTGWMQENPPEGQQDNTIYFTAPNDVQQYEGSVSSKKKYTYENTHGNWTDMQDFADANNQNWYRRTVRGFATTPNQTDWIVDKPGYVNVYESGGAWESSIAYYYDGNPYLLPGSPTSSGWDAAVAKPGNLRAARRAAIDNGAVRHADTFYYYDAVYGNKIKEEIAQLWGSFTSWGTQRVATQTTYESLFNTFPLHVDNALGHRTTYEYDPKWGQPKRIIEVANPTDQVTAHAYDALGRKAATWLPGDDPNQAGAATITYRYRIGGGIPTTVQIGRRKDGGGGSFGRRAYEWRFYDGLGRLIQTQADFDRSSQPIRAMDVNEIRGAVVAHGAPSPFNPVNAGQDRIQASHFSGLRGALQTLWNGAGLGALPGWSSAVTPGGPSLGTAATPIYASDIADLRAWLNLYELDRAYTPTSYANVAGSVVITNRFYSNRGLLDKESAPFVATLKVPGQFDIPHWDPTHPGTSYTYDGLKRPATRTKPDGTSVFRWTYSGWATTAKDELNRKKVYTNDALGRLLTVEEFSGTDPYSSVGTTRYEYDVMDRLKKVIDAQNNQTTIQYDEMGLKKSMTDPDMGTWQYKYNADGTLSEQTDARTQTLTFLYDELMRLRYRKNGSTILGQFDYDEQSGGFATYSGKGRRTTMKFGTNLANTVKYYYDGRGRVVKTDVTIDNNLYTVLTSYDDADRVATITHPNGEVVTYRYGDHGLPVSLESSLKGRIVSAATYNALGKPYDLTLGNGLTTSYRYWGVDYGGYSNYGLLRSIVTGSSALQSLTYDEYDAVGNLKRLIDGRFNYPTGETVSFGYDHLDRLESSSPSLGESFLYDNLGRMTGHNTTGYDYTGTQHLHAPRYVGGTLYDYDANGNLARADNGDRTYEYDVENRLFKVKASDTSVKHTMAYDGDGALRSWTNDAGQKMVYVTADYQLKLVNGQPPDVYVYYRFGGRGIAWHNNSEVRYLLADHLSSSHGEVGADQVEKGQRRYLPFGSDRAVPGASDIADEERYTSQHRIDAGVGYPRRELYYYRARWYLPGVGIFTQPDTIVPDAKNPQALNRYSYVLNNPLNYVDPAGHAAEDLEHLEPNWFDTAWKDKFTRDHGFDPKAADYTYRFLSLGLASNYSADSLMQYLVVAIGAGLSPAGPGLWSQWNQQPDQTGVGERRADWHRRHPRGYPAYGQAPSPESDDQLNFGQHYTDIRWGKVRIIYSDRGYVGRLARILSLGNDNAITFSADLIVFPRPLDFTTGEDRRWLLHELGHVIQAHKLGSQYLSTYLKFVTPFHDLHPMERDADNFANIARFGR